VFTADELNGTDLHQVDPVTRRVIGHACQRREVDWLQCAHCSSRSAVQGPDLQNILQQSYDYLTIMPNCYERLTSNDGRLICKTSYDGRKVFLRHN